MNKIWVLLFFLFSSCLDLNYNQFKDGETVIIKKDTFLVKIDTFFVIGSNRVNPVSIHDEINPSFENLTNREKIFFTPKPMKIGDMILTRTFKRIGKNEF
jgi:hypothetical protein